MVHPPRGHRHVHGSVARRFHDRYGGPGRRGLRQSDASSSRGEAAPSKAHGRPPQVHQLHEWLRTTGEAGGPPRPAPEGQPGAHEARQQLRPADGHSGPPEAAGQLLRDAAGHPSAVWARGPKCPRCRAAMPRNIRCLLVGRCQMRADPGMPGASFFQVLGVPGGQRSAARWGVGWSYSCSRQASTVVTNDDPGGGKCTFAGPRVSAHLRRASNCKEETIALPGRLASSQY